MKKIENIIDNCHACRYNQRFDHGQRSLGTTAVICSKSMQLIGIVAADCRRVVIPDWCPLETYAEAEQDRSTIILPGMPGLEWMTENLSGFGGTEIDGRWYYTYDEAEEAVKQLGNGWRLPIDDEFVALDKLGSAWVEDGPHGIHGRLFGGGLFLDAAGLRRYSSGALTNVGTSGYYWSSSPNSSGSTFGGYLNFASSSVYPQNDSSRANGFSVRCVRNRQ